MPPFSDSASTEVLIEELGCIKGVDRLDRCDLNINKKNSMITQVQKVITEQCNIMLWGTWSKTSHTALILIPSHFQLTLLFLILEDMNHNKASSQEGLQNKITTYIPFCIIAIAHSRWTLCEQGKIWHPLNASYTQKKITNNKNERIIISTKKSSWCNKNDMKRKALALHNLYFLSFEQFNSYAKWDLHLTEHYKKTHTETGKCTCRLTAHLKTDATFIMTRVWSAFVFPLQPFVKTHITHITMEWLVFVYPKKTKNKSINISYSDRL